MTKLWAYIYLWLNNYCLRHVQQMNTTVYDGGVFSKCPICEAEELASKQKLLKIAEDLVRG